MPWLAPAIVAPGVAVLSAQAGAKGDARYLLRDGSSLAAPHVTGAAALLRGLWPDASPSELRSMLMLHAAQGASLPDGSDAGPMDVGAGRLDVAGAARSALVLEASVQDFELADPMKGGRPASLNLPALVEPACIARCSWTRTIRRLSSEGDDTPRWYRLKFERDNEALALHVEPQRILVGPGLEARFEVSADVSRLSVGERATASLILEEEDQAMPLARMPIVVTGAAGRLPASIVIRTDRREGSWPVDGLLAPEIEALGATIAGLKRAETSILRLPADPSNHDPFDAITGTAMIAFQVNEVAQDAAPAERIVVEILRSEAPDVDLYLGRDDDQDGVADRAEVRCTSANAGNVELCEIDDPEPGDWWALAQIWSGSGSGLDRVELAGAVVEGIDRDNLLVEGPSDWPAGGPFSIDTRWSLPSLRADDRWYGSVRLSLDDEGTQPIGRIRLDLIALPAPLVGTPTSSPSATKASTSSPVATATDLPIPSSTPTSSPNATATDLAVATATSTSRPIATATATSTTTATRTPNSTPSPSPTTLSASPIPSPTPIVTCVCSVAQHKVPSAALDFARRNPERFGGWDQPVNANKPAGVYNPLKRCLSIRNASSAYHPLFNGLVFKSGCP
jgi:hypothetical protein